MDILDDRTADPTPGIGHNRSPEPLDPIAALGVRLSSSHRGLVVRFAELELGCARVPNPIATDEDAGLATDFVAQCQTHIRQAETAHKQEKAFFLQASRAVDNFFKRRCEKLNGALGPVVARLRVYRDQIAEAERQRHEMAQRAAEEESRNAAEEAARHRAEAERLERAQDRTGAAEQAILAQDAAVRAEIARRQAASPPEPARIRGDYGATAYVARRWTFEVLDLDRVPREYMSLDVDVVREAITEDGVRDIPGLRIFQAETLRVREWREVPDDERLSAGQIGRDDERSALRFDVPDFLIPKSIADVREMARLITLAEWAPDSYRDLEGNYVQQKIELAIMQGATVGLGPIAAVQSIAVIEGMPTIWGDGALAIVERSGLLEDMHEDYLDDDEGLTAICTMRRRRRPTPIVNCFSMAMAEQACLTRKEGPWQLYPQRMLRMRARSWTLRDGFADVLRGLHIREEVNDFAGGAALPAITPDRAVIARINGRCGPRPRRQFVTAESATAQPRTAPLPEPTVAENPNAQPPKVTQGDTEPLEVEEGLRFTLIDADGVVIDVAGPEALRCDFDRLLMDKCLSTDQVRGLWEWNAAARTAIETQFGAEALSAAAERVAEIDAASGTSEREPPPPEAGASETFAGAAAVASSTSAPPGAAQHPVSPNPDLVLPIDPTWGDQKVFRRDRDGAASEGHEGIGSRFRLSYRQCRGGNAIADQIAGVDEADRRALCRTRRAAGAMLTLPRKLTRPKMGLRSPLQKIWPRHRRWVKSHGCCVPECQESRVDFAHLRSAANAGAAQKPHDMFGISLCRDHHGEQHSLGIDAFGRKYGIDLWALAAEFARQSPDQEMRASLRLVRAEQIGNR